MGVDFHYASCVIGVMTITDLFEKFQTAKALGEAIGRNANRAAEMRKRGSIAPKYWPALIAAAEARGVSLTYEDLVRMHATSVRKTRASRRAPQEASAA